MNIKRYLQIVIICVLSLFHRFVIVFLKWKTKTMITATIGDVSYLRWFSSSSFLKQWQKFAYKLLIRGKDLTLFPLGILISNYNYPRLSPYFISDGRMPNTWKFAQKLSTLCSLKKSLKISFLFFVLNIMSKLTQIPFYS